MRALSMSVAFGSLLFLASGCSSSRFADAQERPIQNVTPGGCVSVLYRTGDLFTACPLAMPTYESLARSSGTCLMFLKINRQGQVTAAEFLRAPPSSMYQFCRVSARGWRFDVKRGRKNPGYSSEPRPSQRLGRLDVAIEIRDRDPVTGDILPRDRRTTISFDSGYIDAQ